jgi:hypothetical protein
MNGNGRFVPPPAVEEKLSGRHPEEEGESMERWKNHVHVLRAIQLHQPWRLSN